VTVRLTDVTDDAVTGTVSSAWSCLGAEFASTAPRSQEDVPSALPQPKLKPGAPPLAGIACNWIVASGTFPPVVQALTVHCAACPRSLLACARATSTQRLTCVVCDTVLAPSCVLVPVGVPVGVGVGFAERVRLGVGVADAVTFAVTLAVALGVEGVADGVADAFVVVFAGGVLVAVFVGVAAGLDFKVRVGAALACADALPLAVAVVVGDALVVVVAGVADGVVGVAVGDVAVAVGVGVGVGVVGVGVGVCVVGVGAGDGLDGAAGGCSGSHDSPLAAVAVLAAAVPAETVRLAPEAASRTLPAISVTVVDRACPKRMKCPISTARPGMPSIRYRAPRKVPPALHTRLSVGITARAVIKTRFLGDAGSRP
jgi:hypothetical protein